MLIPIEIHTCDISEKLPDFKESVHRVVNTACRVYIEHGHLDHTMLFDCVDLKTGLIKHRLLNVSRLCALVTEEVGDEYKSKQIVSGVVKDIIRTSDQNPQMGSVVAVYSASECWAIKGAPEEVGYAAYVESLESKYGKDRSEWPKEVIGTVIMVSSESQIQHIQVSIRVDPDTKELSDPVWNELSAENRKKSAEMSLFGGFFVVD